METCFHLREEGAGEGRKERGKKKAMIMAEKRKK